MNRMRWLYDMHGNAYEFCKDWFDRGYLLAASPSHDPSGPTTGKLRVIRGGSVGQAAAQCRSAFRHCVAVDYRSSNIGFRIVVRLELPQYLDVKSDARQEKSNEIRKSGEPPSEGTRCSPVRSRIYRTPSQLRTPRGTTRQPKGSAWTFTSGADLQRNGSYLGLFQIPDSRNSPNCLFPARRGSFSVLSLVIRITHVIGLVAATPRIRQSSCCRHDRRRNSGYDHADQCLDAIHDSQFCTISTPGAA